MATIASLPVGVFRLLRQAVPMIGQAQEGGTRLLAGSLFGLPQHFLGLFPIEIRCARYHRLAFSHCPYPVRY